MKLTWFGGRTLRVYIGGQIIVFDPTGGPSDTDHSEIVSGADRLIEWMGPYLRADPKLWRPRRVTALEEGADLGVEVYLIGFGARLVDATGEPPLVVMDAIQSAGSWSRDAVVVAFSGDAAQSALEIMAPRIIALALPEAQLDDAIAALADRLDATSLVSLEPGLALEV